MSALVKDRVEDEVLDVMSRYFVGLRRADPEILRSVFHDELNYVNATKGAFVSKGLGEYLWDVAQRQPEDQRGSSVNPKIKAISHVNDRIIVILASMRLMGRIYRDALTLILDGGQWKIISKVFTHSSERKV
ncbi:nuclear transport factor 2 family protein [Erythrobacter sp. GH1-10]|uniref:nuclear transport factor 2 family protein n=1 Tax=Erythrobacter sp. GH1-10 TaxID=3349334 RepID=UPI003877C7B1